MLQNEEITKEKHQKVMRKGEYTLHAIIEKKNRRYDFNTSQRKGKNHESFHKLCITGIINRVN